MGRDCPLNLVGATADDRGEFAEDAAMQLVASPNPRLLRRRPAVRVSAEAKHDLRFEEAAELFRGESDYLEIADLAHSADEDRFIAIGPIRRGLILVVWTERDGDTVRIISARFASKRETELFHRSMENER